MDNYLLMKKDAEAEERSAQLGFRKALFLNEDFIMVGGNNTRDLIKKIISSKKTGRIIITRVSSEELLRFVLGKTPADIVLGAENIHPKDSLHYPRAGLDQVLCTLAAGQGKIIAFSFSDVFNASNRPRLLSRMMFNAKLCRKYKVKTLISTFAKHSGELRSAADLLAFSRLLGL